MKPAESSRAIEWTIAICAVVFVIVLAVAAYWDASIRILHVLEALPYLAAAALAVNRKKFGYALGTAGGALWLNVAGRGSTFINNGFQVLVTSVRSGHIVRPDILIAVPAAMATAGLVCSSFMGYFKLPRRRWSDVALFGVAVVLVTVYYYVICLVFSPQFLVPLKRAFAF